MKERSEEKPSNPKLYHDMEKIIELSIPQQKELTKTIPTENEE